MLIELDFVISVGIPVVVWLLMLTVGSDVNIREFRSQGTRPGALLAASLAQFLLLPLIAIGLVFLLNPVEAVTAGLVLVAACPGGSLSNFYCYLAGANPTYSVLLTISSTVLALPLSPLVAGAGIHWLLAGEVGVDDLEFRILMQLVFMLILPVGLGATVRSFFPQWVERARTGLRLLGLLGVAVIIVLIIASQASQLERQAWSIARAALLFTVLSMAAGWSAARLLGLNEPDRFVLTIEFSVRNMPIATLIAVSVLASPEFALFAAVFVLTQLPLVMLLIAIRWLKNRSLSSAAMKFMEIALSVEQDADARNRLLVEQYSH